MNKFIRRFLLNRDRTEDFVAPTAKRGTTGMLAVGFLFALILCCGSAWGQKDTGVIAGTVRDASGAVVAGAKVRVKDIDHGTEFDTTTEANGEYVAGPLKVGRYTITVEKGNFKTAIAGPVQLDVQGRIEADVKLEIGEVSQKVEVTVQNPLLETETSTMGQVMDKTRIETLPLNGRNFAQLAQLGVGVVPSEPGSRVSGNFGFSVDGARSLQNNFLLDGIDNNSNLGDVLNESSYVIQPPIDAIEEFKVQTNDYSAEFGRGNGAILNAVIKSGTNAFHGDVFEYFRNDALDASPFFIVTQKPAYKQNQFGGTLGGPIHKGQDIFLCGLRRIPFTAGSAADGDSARSEHGQRRFFRAAHQYTGDGHRPKLWQSDGRGGTGLQRQSDICGGDLQRPAYSRGADDPRQSRWILRRADRSRRLRQSYEHFPNGIRGPAGSRAWQP